MFCFAEKIIKYIDKCNKWILQEIQTDKMNRIWSLLPINLWHKLEVKLKNIGYKKINEENYKKFYSWDCWQKEQADHLMKDSGVFVEEISNRSLDIFDERAY